MPDRERRLRILYLADTMAQVQMLEGLAARFSVTLLVPESLGERATTFWPPRGGAVDRVFLRGGRLAYLFRAPWWITRRRRRFDAVVALDNLGAALAATLARRLGGPPVVLQVGRPTLEYLEWKRSLLAPLPFRARRALARILVRFNEGRAAAVGAVSQFLADRVSPGPATVRAIPWQGVDPERFRPGDRRAARAALGLPDDLPIVLCRSRLAPEKDPDTFLAAIHTLAEAGRPVRAVYMGGEHEEMARIAARHGVELVGRNARTADEIPLWYRAADVCVQTSHAEGLGLSVLEALACETPVVVTDVGGLPETVDGGRCGSLVPAGDVSATASAIRRYLDDPDLAADHAARGRQLVVDRYTPTHAFEEWARLIEAAATRRERILFVDHETELSGGGERDLVDLASGLVALGVEIHAAVPGEGALAKALRHIGVHVHPVPMNGALLRASRWDLARRPWLAARHLAAAVTAAARLARLARRLGVSVVHSHSMKAHLLAVPAARVARARHVWHVKDILEDGWLGRAFSAVAGVEATRVVCISGAVAHQFEGTRAGRKAEAVYCGLRPEPASASAAASARRQFGAAPGNPLVGLVGHTARWKGHDVFLDAAALLAPRLADVRFAVVAGCTFPENEGGFDAACRGKVEDLGLSDRLTWLDHVDDVAAAMAAFDVCVHASRLPEPFGRVLVEAMAQGTPVVTTNIGGAVEIVPPAAGRLIEPGDPELLADTLAELLADRGKLQAMGEAARAEAARFDIAVAAEAWKAVYDSIA